MTESISIKNFGPIRKVEIKNIRPMTVLIGESGSGKSTIIKVLVLFRWIYKMMNIRSYLKHSNISKSPFRFRFNDYLLNNGLDRYVSDETQIVYKRGSYEVTFHKGKLSGTQTSDLILSEELSLEKNCFISDKRNLVSDLVTQRAGFKRIPFYLNETFEDYTLASHAIQSHNVDYLGVQLKIKKTSQGNKHFVEGNGYSIELRDASSGTQTVLPLSLIVEYYTNKYDLIESFNRSIFNYLAQSDRIFDFKPINNLGAIPNKRVNIHIEEPELSLFPASQCELIDSLVDRCFHVGAKNWDRTLIMATHSPYIINHLNLLIKRKYASNASGLSIDPNLVDVYKVGNGELESLMYTDVDTNERVIDTNDLTEPMVDIYNEYISYNS